MGSEEQSPANKEQPSAQMRGRQKESTTGRRRNTIKREGQRGSILGFFFIWREASSQHKHLISKAGFGQDNVMTVELLYVASVSS